MPKSNPMTLPKSVIQQDHRLEKAAEDAGRKLCELRWHWTLDESNPKRVSFSQYARDVGHKGHSTIQRYAKAAPLMGRNPTMSVFEAIKRSDMSEDQQQVTETVARRHGVTFGTAAQRKEYREEARQIADAKKAVKHMMSGGPITPKPVKDSPEYSELCIAIGLLEDDMESLRENHLRGNYINKISSDDLSDLRILVKSLRKLATDIESDINKKGNNGTGTVTNITSARSHQKVS